MIWVGLTGGIASGKSTVSRFLLEEGAFIIDADKIVHKLLLRGSKVYQTIVETFGDDVIDDSKEIDHKELGEMIFRNPTQRQTLNQIVHPSVFERAESEKKAIIAKHPKGVIVFDAALLIETNSHKKMDWVLLAYVDRATQVERLIERDHLSKDDAALRIGSQIPIEEKVSVVDEVINCHEPLPQVKESVHRIYLRLKKKA